MTHLFSRPSLWNRHLRVHPAQLYAPRIGRDDALVGFVAPLRAPLRIRVDHELASEDLCWSLALITLA
jgi:hypothetical protein